MLKQEGAVDKPNLSGSEPKVMLHEAIQEGWTRFVPSIFPWDVVREPGLSFVVPTIR
jgi:hypothetical protein